MAVTGHMQALAGAMGDELRRLLPWVPPEDVRVDSDPVQEGTWVRVLIPDRVTPGHRGDRVLGMHLQRRALQVGWWREVVVNSCREMAERVAVEARTCAECGTCVPEGRAHSEADCAAVVVHSL